MRGMCQNSFFQNATLFTAFKQLWIDSTIKEYIGKIAQISVAVTEICNHEKHELKKKGGILWWGWVKLKD